MGFKHFVNIVREVGRLVWRPESLNGFIHSLKFTCGTKPTPRLSVSAHLLQELRVSGDRLQGLSSVFWQLLFPSSCSHRPDAASSFPQCTSTLTTKMADVMEEYEKEAGCVPILHPEVGAADSSSSHTHLNIPEQQHISSGVGDCTTLPRLFWKLRCPLQNHRWGVSRQLTMLKLLTLAPTSCCIAGSAGQMFVVMLQRARRCFPWWRRGTASRRPPCRCF